MGNSLPRNICVMLKYHLGMNEAQFIFINCNFSKLVFGRMARQLLAYNYINNRSYIFMCHTQFGANGCRRRTTRRPHHTGELHFKKIG